MNGCVIGSVDLYGLVRCGRKGSVYDRARKGWLCRDHATERLCEFCHAERAWAKVWHQDGGMACEIRLCAPCAGWVIRRS